MDEFWEIRRDDWGAAFYANQKGIAHQQ